MYVSHLAISQGWQSLTYYSCLQKGPSKCNTLGEKDARNFTQNSYFETSLIIESKLKWLYLHTLRDDLLRENKDSLQCFSGGWNDNPLQYPCLGNPMDKGARQATSQGVKELDMTWRLNCHLGVIDIHRLIWKINIFTALYLRE